MSPLWRAHDFYFRSIGLKAWTSGAVPYSGVCNYNEAFKKAYLLIENFKNKNLDEILILEVAAGYGEFAKNFIEAFTNISRHEGLQLHKKIKYYISDYSSTTLNELKASKRLDKFKEYIEFLEFDVLKRNLELRFDAVLGNYILDQFPARVFAKDGEKYLEKYISVDPQIESHKKYLRKNKWIKHLKKQIRFIEIDLDKEISLSHREILETCFKKNKNSTVVYSYTSLKVVNNLLYLLKPNGILVLSDFNASTRSGIDPYEPCYYGNSIAHPVNFEFLCKYFNPSSNDYLNNKDYNYQLALLYEDPIKPLHTLILTRPEFSTRLELGQIYYSVYHKNLILRWIHKYLIELQISLGIFLVIMVLYLLLYSS